MIKKTTYILKDTSHPLYECYSVAKYGRRNLSERARMNRYCNSFLATSIRLFKRDREGGSKLRGGLKYNEYELYSMCDYDYYYYY